MIIQRTTGIEQRARNLLFTGLARPACRLLLGCVFIAAGVFAEEKADSSANGHAAGAERPSSAVARAASVRGKAEGAVGDSQQAVPERAALGNSPLRRSQVLPGTITKVAGTGFTGFRGDGGPATEAELQRPTGLAVDGQGNLYIADTYNLSVRRVDAEGTITTVAGTGVPEFSGDGGPATEAALQRPSGLALDGQGNLYIADTYNLSVRRVDAEGTITTVAGTGGGPGSSGDGGPATEAALGFAFALAVDGQGNLYISDFVEHRVRRVDAGGIITTVAGTGGPGFSGDGGPATEAELNSPAGLALDGQGNLYIADSTNRRVRRVDAGGIITTVAELDSPVGLALDGQGNLYIADAYNNRVLRVDAGGTITTVAGTGAALQLPTMVALDGQGNLYIADTDNNRVLRVEQPALVPAPDGETPVTETPVTEGTLPPEVTGETPGPWTTSVETLDVSVLAARAEQGSLEAQYRYGMLLWFGFGAPQDAAKSTEWIRRAAEGGHAEATVALIERYLGVDGSEPDGLEAARWVRGQAEGGSAAAQLLLGKMHQAGTGVAQSMPEAVRWIRAAAEQGSADAERQLGLLYRTGAGVPADEMQASRWYHAQGPAGTLGEDAMQRLREAAENGSAAAQYFIAAAHYELDRFHGATGLEPARYLDMLRAAAEGGEARAQHYVGLVHFNGYGVRQDRGEARRWLRRGAEQGDDSSALLLSEMLAGGIGGAPDAGESARWLGAVARRGLAVAKVRLAERYLSGTGVARDESAAVRWLAAAAGDGSSAGESARFALALMHLYGAAVPDLLAVAVAEVRELAETREDAAAQAYLGLMHYHGKGAAKDDAAAAEWLRSAAGLGYEPASWYLARLAELGVAEAAVPPEPSGEAVRGVAGACEGCSGWPGGEAASHAAAFVPGGERRAVRGGPAQQALDLCAEETQTARFSSESGVGGGSVPVPERMLAAECAANLVAWGRARFHGGIDGAALAERAIRPLAGSVFGVPGLLVSAPDIWNDLSPDRPRGGADRPPPVIPHPRDNPGSAAELVTDVWQEALRAERCSVEFDLLGGDGGAYSDERAIWEERPASVGGQLRRWVSSEGAPGWTAWQRLYDFGDDATVAGLGLPTGIRHRISANGCEFGSAGVELRFESPYLGMEFAWVPAGSFVMGSESSEADSDEVPLTRVRISEGYWLGRHEVTQGQWEAVMGTNPSRFDECGADCPVERVTWYDARSFISRLNERMQGAGRGERYGLPSEAEWEYAARAGVSGEAGERHGPLDDVAWCGANGGLRTRPVGLKRANGWGLHDMLGNVFEWTSSRYGDYPGGEVTDWRGPSRLSGSPAIRGGGSADVARFCRAADRRFNGPAGSDDYLGFRLRRTGSGGSATLDDHGNVRATATRLEAGEWVAGRIDPQGDVDYFVLEVTGGEALIEVETEGDLDTEGILTDELGSRVGSDDDGGAGGNFRIEATVGAGRYYVAVLSSGNGASGSYRVQYRRQDAPPTVAEAPEAGDVWANSLGMEFAWVPAGSFVMGSESSEAGGDEVPLTRVEIGEGYWLGRHEVTQGQWEAVMGTNPSHFDECGQDCPVESVSWDDVQEFLAELNGRMERAGRGERYGMPSEAEWEYAARAGVSGEAGERHGPVDEVAWHWGNSGRRTHEVGGKVANGWGLHDMLGNVWEWTGSWYGDYPGGSVTDWQGPSRGSRRVNRGGSWINVARNCRAALRNGVSPGYRVSYLGFRLRRTR